MPQNKIWCQCQAFDTIFCKMPCVAEEQAVVRAGIYCACISQSPLKRPVTSLYSKFHGLAEAVIRLNDCK